MKLFFSEFGPNYKKYHFPYQVWLLKEKEDQVEKIYENGFLPIRSLPGVYYLSRSLRVDLAKFHLSSENRRILKKTEEFQSDLIPLTDLRYTPVVQKFCKNYLAKRFNEKGLTAAAVRSIFKKGVFNYVFVWKEKKNLKEIGYAVCFASKNLIQYAHAFYNLEYFEQSLGARMMLEAVTWAKENQKQYIYLGTCYEKSAFYKTGFSGLEFFNGFRWSNNLEELKDLVKNKDQKGYLLKDKEFLKKFYDEDLTLILNTYGIRVNF